MAELDLDVLVAAAELVPTARPLSPYPPVGRDVNIVVAESVRWAEVEHLVREPGGELLEAVEYQETYRDPQRLGAGKKSLLFSLQLRSAAARSPTKKPTACATGSWRCWRSNSARSCGHNVRSNFWVPLASRQCEVPRGYPLQHWRDASGTRIRGRRG